MKHANPQNLEQEVTAAQCPKCSSSNLKIVETKDVLDELAEIAEQTGASVEVISTQTEEGVSLKESFGGIAAILRYKQP